MPKGSLASHLAMKTHQRSEGRDFPLGEGMFLESFWNFVAGEQAWVSLDPHLT